MRVVESRHEVAAIAFGLARGGLWGDQYPHCWRENPFESMSRNPEAQKSTHVSYPCP